MAEEVNVYRVDPERLGGRPTGFAVRALLDGAPGSYDIAELDRASLMLWLRSRGGANEWAENLVLALLGYEMAPF